MLSGGPAKGKPENSGRGPFVNTGCRPPYASVWYIHMPYALHTLFLPCIHVLHPRLASCG